MKAKTMNIMKNKTMNIFAAGALMAIACSAPCASPGEPTAADSDRYIQCRNGEIQILPALTKEEIPSGSVKGARAVGGFIFDIEWRENKMTKMRVTSEKGGVCRIRSYGGIGSPILRKAKGRCANAEIAATANLAQRDAAPPCDTQRTQGGGASSSAGVVMPESVFNREKNPLSSICVDFDTSPGEVIEFRGTSGNQDWTDYARSLSDDFLKTEDAARIAQNVLDWQLDTGGWPKNVPMQDALSPRERKAVLAFKPDRKRGTIDNGATFTEMRFLARMAKANAGSNIAEKCLAGVEKGLDFLLYMQYPNGGWPQCDPAKVGYWHQITYNDGAMVNVMNLLRDVYEGRAPFDIPLPEEKKSAARAAFDKGLVCIFKTQVRQNGRLTVWCQQHDRDTLEPCFGRAFELPSLCSLESAGILDLLMSLNPEEYTPKFRRVLAESLRGAVEWYDKTAMLGYKVERNWRRPDGIMTSRLVRIPPEESKPMWCRYYTLDKNRPFTGRRDSTMNFDFSEMERGENMSYMWFNECGSRVKRNYLRWLKKNAKSDKERAMRMLRSEMKRMPVPCGIDKRKKPKWEYTDGLLLQSALAVGARHKEVRKESVAWAQDYIDRMVTKDGEILGYRKADCKLDCINPGKFAFDMYELAVARGEKGAAEATRLRKVLDEQFSQFAIQPRVKEGGFWHKTVYPHQMWLDGIYMGCPFYARYAAKFLEGDAQRKAFDDIANQFAVVTRHTYDEKTGLYRHGWDEAKAQVWADKATGRSAHAWGRALGWFAAAIVDTLDYIPDDHPEHAELVALLKDYAASLRRWQDPSGAWWQVADAPGREGNYLEATSTALIGYALIKGAKRGWLGDEAMMSALEALAALDRDFVRYDADGTVSLTRCCAVAGLSADRDGSFEYYLREPIRDNDHKGTGPYMLLSLEAEKL